MMRMTSDRDEEIAARLLAFEKISVRRPDFPLCFSVGGNGTAPAGEDRDSAGDPSR